MSLENGRDIFRGILILVFAAVPWLVDLPIGLALAVFIGVMILQGAFTDWCPAALVMKPLGLKKKPENLQGKF